MADKLKQEIDAFQGVWKGGYFEGDPLDPFAPSYFGEFGFMSVLHATYLRCIKPYIHADTVALEIGPGRGAWTRAMLAAREVCVLDALSAEHNRFFEYLGHPQHVKYFQVQDFSCRELPDAHFNYMFSFGCLCHVSFDGISQYAKNTFAKMQPGAECFWMIADYEKYNWAVANLGNAMSVRAGDKSPRKHQPIAMDADDEPRAGGRWYHAGVGRTCEVLEAAGYRIVDPDVGTNLRDPIIHFRKP